MYVFDFVHGMALLDRGPLSLEAPEHVGAGEVGLVRIVFRAPWINPVDATMLRVAVRRNVGITLSPLGIQSGRALVRGGIVLDHEVIPVTDPEGSVRANLGADRTRPGVGGVVDIVWLLPQLKARALGVADPLSDQFSGRGTNEGDGVPVIFRETPGGVEGMPGTSGIAVMCVNLPDISRGREKQRVVVCSWSTGLGETGLLVKAAWKAQVEAWIRIGG